jgi:cell division cycle 14
VWHGVSTELAGFFDREPSLSSCNVKISGSFGSQKLSLLTEMTSVVPRYREIENLGTSMTRPRPMPAPAIVDIMPNRFVFSVIRGIPPSDPHKFFFSIESDEAFTYQPFYSDFGPLSLLQIHLFIQRSLAHLTKQDTVIHFYSSSTPQHVANAILVAAAFRLVQLHLSPSESVAPFHALLPLARAYRDASPFPTTFDLSVSSCLHGLDKAMKLGWYDPDKFDAQTWGRLEAIEHGDMNWIIPGKLLAFAAPYNTNLVQGYRVCTPADLLPTFRALGITTIVRLNNKTYEEAIFKSAGLSHLELFFPDGSCPSDSIVREFLQIIESPQIIALHCKAGLGRTYFCFLIHRGTLAGCHLIKNFGFSAHEAIGWIRICRPGSIIGPQQQFLVAYYQKFRQPPPESLRVHPGPRPTRRPVLSVPVKDGPRTAAGDRKVVVKDVRTPVASRGRVGDALGLQLQAMAIVPQPRKLERAQNRARRTPRKL